MWEEKVFFKYPLTKITHSIWPEMYHFSICLFCFFNCYGNIPWSKCKNVSLRTLKQESWRVCWKAIYLCYCKLKTSVIWERFSEVGLSSDLHCRIKVLHFLSVALAFSFFPCSSFPPSTKIRTHFFAPFQQLHSSPCIIVDFPWWICGGLFWGSVLAPTCTTVIQLW